MAALVLGTMTVFAAAACSGGGSPADGTALISDSVEDQRVAPPAPTPLAATAVATLEPTPEPTPEPSPEPLVTLTSDAGGQLSVVEIVRRLRPSVVVIFVTLARGGGSGSGVIISEDGVILTNHHVIDGAREIRVDLQMDEGGEHLRFEATVLGSDPEIDIALIKIDGGPFEAAELGSIDDLELGERVVALGFPLVSLTGAGLTVTEGIVSSKFNDGVRRVIQHQAPVNPGNSGGPLVSLDGKVVGLNTFVLRQAAGTNVEGFNFAVAIDEAVSRIDQLMVKGPPVSTEAELVVTNVLREFSVTLPPGWNVIFKDEKGFQAASSATGALFAVSAERDVTTFDSPDQWSAQYHRISTDFLQEYQLLEQIFTETPAGELVWTFTGMHRAQGLTFLVVETLVWSGERAARFYVQAPEANFRAAVPDFDAILGSFTYLDAP